MTATINNVKILDLEQDQLRPETSIVIGNERIKSLSGNTEDTDNSYDAQGCYAIPSFIDTHTHITFPGRSHHSPRDFDYQEKKKYAVAQGAQNLMEALMSGVCLVRDMGSLDENVTALRNYQKKKKVIGPEVVTSGYALVVDQEAHGAQFGLSFDTLKEGEEVLQERADKGYECVKVMNGPELFERETLEFIVDKAHDLSLQVAVHAFTETGIRNGIAAGADSIEHAVVFDQETLQLAREKETSFVPTYYCAWLSLRDNFTAGLPQEEVQHLKDWWQFLQDNFSYHIDNDMNVLTGTDAGFAPCNFVDIKDEIKMFAHKGLTPNQALRSATIAPARAMGKERDYGTIDEGKYANFILLKEDPRQNLDTIDHPAGIWYRGADVTNYLDRPWK